MVDYDTIYPELPQSNKDLIEASSSGSNFRLHKINTVLSKLESEEEHYRHVRKKYAKARSVFQKTSVVVMIGTLGQ